MVQPREWSPNKRTTPTVSRSMATSQQTSLFFTNTTPHQTTPIWQTVNLHQRISATDEYLVPSKVWTFKIIARWILTIIVFLKLLRFTCIITQAHLRFLSSLRTAGKHAVRGSFSKFFLTSSQWNYSNVCLFLNNIVLFYDIIRTLISK